MNTASKLDLTAVGRDVLLKMAERCVELESRFELSLVEQMKPADEQTIPTCLFCELIVADGKRAVAAATGAMICEDCIARAVLAIAPEGEDAATCSSFPGCGCTNLDTCRRNR